MKIKTFVVFYYAFNDSQAIYNNTSLEIIRLPPPDTNGSLRQVVTLPDRYLPPDLGTSDIEIIPYKCLLRVLMSQHQLILLHVLNLCILRNTLFVIVIILLYARRKERCRQLLLQEFLPVNLLEPRMAFDLLDAIRPQPRLWFALNETIHKVHTLTRPAKWRDLVKLHLLG